MTQSESTSEAPAWAAGETHLGFRVAEVVPLPYLRGVYFALEHLATGARYIHIQCPDRENAFGVAFKTVPTDSTGVAHILEHTVLCGSRKFPVRDPFFSMLKRSLSSFMNAFTASDWTLYPFATQNRKDFYNLLDVYLDATFFPRLDRLSFKQEGHRMEFENGPDGDRRLVYKGVVYNEMKGAMSSPDQALSRSLLQALFPDTTYRFNSGGDPQDIPELTAEGLRAFHKRHYHPSNAFFYSYGNLPLEDHLTFINRKVLDGFSRIDPRTEVPSQPRWEVPREAAYPYPLAPDEDPTRKYQIGIAWLTSDIRDVHEVLVLTLLEEILMGNPASPLRQALLESGLGSSLADSTGFDADNRDTLFFCGLKDVAETDGEQIAALIMATLNRLVEEGIDPDLIESAIHQVEFHRREITNTPYPYGLRLLVTLTGTWIHGGQPRRLLLFEDDMVELRRQMATPGFFEKRLRRHFIDNPHRVFFKLVPDQQLADTQLRAETDRLRQVQNSLTPGAVTEIEKDTEALQRLQDEDENVAVLPTLTLADISPTVNRVAPTSTPDNHLTIYDAPTAGIFYLSSSLDLAPLPAAYLPLVPLFCYAATRMGTADRDYVDLARYLDRYTGGMGLSVQARSRFDGNFETLPMVAIGGKCLDRNRERLFSVIEEILAQIRFGDLDQLKRVILEYRAIHEGAVVHNGHRLAIALASRSMTPAAHLNEMWHGVHQLQFVKTLTKAMEKDAGLLAQTGQQLSEIAGHLFRQGNMQMALIGNQAATAQESATVLMDRLPGDFNRASAPALDPPDGTPAREGWHTGTAVSFVAQCLPCVRYAHADAPALAVTAKLLRSLYLHREIREKGGAYGGFALYNPEEGLFSFGSYRDPHIQRTLDVYAGVSAFITSGDYSEEDIHEAILQVCAEIDKPDPPGPAARKAFYRRLVGLDDDQRQQFKERLLRLDRDTVRRAAERHLSQPDGRMATAVIASREKLERANQAMPEHALELHAI